MKAAISRMVNKAVFFDRDGVLNVDVHYLYRKDDFIWTDGAIDAIKYCNAEGYKVIVITNQSGVSRGYYAENDVKALHVWMNEELAKHGAHIDDFFYCPHHPEGTVPGYNFACDCRKPSPKLIDRACAKYAIDKSQSFMIGDKSSDMECAENARVCGILFRGGSLYEQVKKALEALHI